MNAGGEYANDNKDQIMNNDQSALPKTEESPAKLSPSAQDVIGRKLKAIYDEIVQQPVPANLLDLLQELERKEGER